MNKNLVNRYLMKFSYVGSRYNGVAKQTDDKSITVHNVIESYLNNNNKTIFKDFFELKSHLHISSRTDAGVHAFLNTAHFDLTIKNEKANLNNLCNQLKYQLNRKLIKNNHLIRVLDIERVRPDFVARHAKSRTYLYRLARLKNGTSYWNDFDAIKKVEAALIKSNQGKTPNFSIFKAVDFNLNNFINVFERDYLTELREPFNHNLFVKAINSFNGQHNFSAFTTQSGRLEMIKNKRCPIKNVKIDFKTDKIPFLNEYFNKYDEMFNIIEIEITAESFLYKMIRKMVGAAYDVAKGKISLDQINQMMLNPPDYYNKNVTTVMKPNGLFLKNVEYDPNFFLRK